MDFELAVPQIALHEGLLEAVEAAAPGAVVDAVWELRESADQGWLLTTAAAVQISGGIYPTLQLFRASIAFLRGMYTRYPDAVSSTLRVTKTSFEMTGLERLDPDLVERMYQAWLSSGGRSNRWPRRGDMALSRVQYGRQIAGFGAQLGAQYTILTDDAAVASDPVVRTRLVQACHDLRAIFPRARAMEPPPDFRAAHATFCAALDRYEEALNHRLSGAALMDQGDTERGIETWRLAAPLEFEANDLTRRAARQIQDG
jgi:hypothetical protein